MQANRANKLLWNKSEWEDLKTYLFNNIDGHQYGNEKKLTAHNISID